MRRFQFKIAGILVSIFILGVGFAALRESNDLWESGVFTLTIGILLISILLAVHRMESRRAFWIGFAMFGWAYLTLSLVPSIETRLMTTKALHYLDSKVPGRSLKLYAVINGGIGRVIRNNQVSKVTYAIDGTQLTTSSQGQVRVWDVATSKLLGGWIGTTENFVRIGHSLFALLAAWLGGQLSRRLCRSPRSLDPTSVAEEQGLAL